METNCFLITLSKCFSVERYIFLYFYRCNGHSPPFFCSRSLFYRKGFPFSFQGGIGVVGQWHNIVRRWTSGQCQSAVMTHTEDLDYGQRTGGFYEHKLSARDRDDKWMLSINQNRAFVRAKSCCQCFSLVAILVVLPPLCFNVTRVACAAALKAATNALG